MNPEDLQSYVASGRLTQNQVQKLLSLNGAHCIHRSWGFGKVVSFDLVLGQILIDFESKPAHPMQLAYAADSLTAIPNEHILAQKSLNLDGLKTKADSNPEEIIRLFATSFGEQATAERLENVLSGSVIPKDKWSKWISNAKRASKKDGKISWPTKKTDPIKALDKPVTPVDVLHEQLSKVRTLADLLTIAEDVLKKVGKSTDFKLLVPELVAALDDQIKSNSDRNPSVVLEAIWIRDDLLKFSDTKASAVNIQSLVQEVHNVHELVKDLSAHRQKHILPIIKQSFPDWEQRIKTLIPTSGGKLLTEIVDFFAKEQKEAELQEMFQRALREQKAGQELMIWLCKNRDEPSYAKWLPQLIHGRFLINILHQLEAAALEAGGRRKNPLSELLLSDPTLVADLVRGCDAEEAKDLGKAILMNPAIEELDKRSLMARLIKVSPSVQSLLVSNQQTKTESLIVSWESLERRKQEYEEIINKKIPENSKEIAIARSYGDLRENHEFKAAKEMQTVLMRQKAELEEMLARARGTDFYKPDISAVNIGTKVTLQDLETGKEETHSILGAWDGDPEKKIVSYQAGLAKAIIGKKISEEAEIPGDTGNRRVKILSISAAINESAEETSPSTAQAVNA